MKSDNDKRIAAGDMTCFDWLRRAQVIFIAIALLLLMPSLAFAQTAQSLFTSQTPSIPDISDGVPYELGMEFQATKPGTISAIRYWKAASDSGTHVGRIWSAGGALLTSVTFSGETASGWQQQALTTPLAIQANTTYVVSVSVGSYFPISTGGLAQAVVNGDLRSVADGSNGVFGSSGAFPTNSYQNSNYFRDVVFTASATGTPSIVKVGGDNQSGTTGATLPSPLTVEVDDATGAPQPGTSVTFSVIGGGGSVSPSTATTGSNGRASTTLTLGGTAGANTVRATASGIGSVDFSATATAPSSGGGQTLFSTQTPDVPSGADGVSYELGMKFRAAKSGQITAILHWKSPGETGGHVGRIWSANGALLSSVTFSGESASGWQIQNLSTPLQIQANTTYVVSVNINSNYPFTGSGLASAIVNGDLSSVADGANGIYGGAGSFPTASYFNANYFRDVLFIADGSSGGGGNPTIVKTSGDNQQGAPNATLASPLVVQVKDGNNNPMPNVLVNFAVSSGASSVSPASRTTDSNGLASTSLTLGAAGTTSVTATAASVGSVTFNAISGNAIFLENQKAGTANVLSDLNINYTSTVIAGYASGQSVNKGNTISFKVSTAQPGPYRINIYRLGNYGGLGARLVTSSAMLNGVTQSACAVTDQATKLVECNWPTAYTVNVGTDWTSGLYMAKVVHTSTRKEHPIFFIVRDDASSSQVLFQASRSTALAYNNYGSANAQYSLYDYNSTNGAAAKKVSLDRPSKEMEDYSHLLNYEFPMARWMESQGYDISYTTNFDVHTNPSLLLQHKVFLSVGHDEYWSREMRDAVEQARDSGVNLGFFSANTSYWRVRMEPSSSGTPNRVMVCYKTTTDPVSPTNRWRDPSSNRPENAMIGVMYIGDCCNVYAGYDYVVSNASDPYFANTGLTNGSKLTKLVGYEWDAIVNNGFSPPGVVTLSASPVTAASIAEGQPSNPSQIAHSSRYTAASGAKVFATGSIQWVWGLDAGYFVSPARVDTRAKQIAVNVLSSMGARPINPSAGIVVP